MNVEAVMIVLRERDVSRCVSNIFRALVYISIINVGPIVNLCFVPTVSGSGNTFVGGNSDSRPSYSDAPIKVDLGGDFLWEGFVNPMPDDVKKNNSSAFFILCTLSTSKLCH